MIRCDYCLKERQSHLDNSVTNKNYQNQIVYHISNLDLDSFFYRVINILKGHEKDTYYRIEEMRGSLFDCIGNSIIVKMQENKEQVCIYCASRLRKSIAEIAYNFEIENNTWNKGLSHDENRKLNAEVGKYLNIKYFQDIRANLETIITMATAIFLENRVKKIKKETK